MKALGLFLAALFLAALATAPLLKEGAAWRDARARIAAEQAGTPVPGWDNATESTQPEERSPQPAMPAVLTAACHALTLVQQAVMAWLPPALGVLFPDGAHPPASTSGPLSPRVE